jgi:para-nitrobenzyl esterase
MTLPPFSCRGLLFLGLAAALRAGDPTVDVSTVNGWIQGTVSADGIRTFKGIPYALPPVGDRRWQAPQPMPEWKGTRPATAFGDRPMQVARWKDMVFRSAQNSEDCLYLNVWSSQDLGHADAPVTPEPVLVYFHGGGLVGGDGSEPRYDGASMAKRKIVVVTVNYRLGVFGNFSLPELTAESPHHASGNQGHLDQVAALQWVRMNIIRFGGDPQRITIAGQSAGSASVSALMASPLSKDLLHGAIGESGSILGNPQQVTLQQAEADGLALQAQLGASSLAALRAIPAAELLAKTKGLGFARRTLVDGYFLPERPEEIFFTGRQADIPLLAGWNSAEMLPSDVLGEDASTPEAFAAAVQRLYGDKAGQVLALYPATTPAEVARAATELASDRSIGYRTWKWLDMHAKSSGHPVFRYLYAHLLPPETDPSDGNDQTLTHPLFAGPRHSAEIPYALGNLALVGAYHWGPDDFKTSEVLQGYFANFITTGNPNGPGLPRWTGMQASIPHVMVIAAEPHLIPEPNLKRYTWMDTP